MLSRNIILGAFLAVLAGCSTDYAGLRRGKDLYPDLAALKAGNIEGRDYSREFYNRGSSVAVFAIHGGDIELFTSRLARRIADRDLNLYIFNGWLGEESGRLHITAAHFDDPEAVRLAAASALGISVHAQAEPGRRVCVGGSNREAAEITVSRLRAAGFSAEFPCARSPGVSPQNIVNRASKGGVQLEITMPLLKRLESSPLDLSKFTEAVRNAVSDYLTQGEKQ
ncbi:MAG: poly-gamma-glutamate hydrolase family protein [Elusimicrobia bacterium]|nr:poly-gamma-glutamate hydrolase family protein [Elusimicrobiota bacterium]